MLQSINIGSATYRASTCLVINHPYVVLFLLLCYRPYTLLTKDISNKTTC